MQVSGVTWNTNRFDRTKVTEKKRGTHPVLATSDQLLVSVLSDTCVPNCCSGTFSYVATVCVVLGLQPHFASGFSKSRSQFSLSD